MQSQDYEIKAYQRKFISKGFPYNETWFYTK